MLREVLFIRLEVLMESHLILIMDLIWVILMPVSMVLMVANM